MDNINLESRDTMSKSRPKVLKWALIIGIIIVLNLFFNYSLSLVYVHPEYENFCKNEQVISPPTTKNTCVDIGGQWIENTYPKEIPVPTETKPVNELRGYCNPSFTCQKNFESANKVYERNVFITLILLGIVTIIIGMFSRTSEAISIALSLGGVLSFLIASVRYWSYADNLIKVIILGLSLAVMVWVGIKKFNE